MITIASIQQAVAREYGLPFSFMREPAPTSRTNFNPWIVSRPRLAGAGAGVSPISSAKGIFPAPSSKGLPLRALNRRKKAARLRSESDKMDAFADLLADGYDPGPAALMLGWVPEHGETMLRRIRKRLGPQAV